MFPKITFTLLIALLISTSAHALQISQMKLEMTKNKDSSVEVQNTTSNPVSIQIEIVEEKHPKSLEKLPKDFKHCEGSLKAFPKLFNLEPGKYQNVKFLSREAGNCRVYFTENVIRPADEKKEAIPVVAVVEADKEMTLDLRMPIKTGIPCTVK